MMKTSIILEKFSGLSHSKIEIKEKISTLSIKVKLDIMKPDLIKFVEKLNGILPERDSLQVHTRSNSLDLDLGYNTADSKSVEKFLAAWENSFNEFSVTINKSVKDNIISIYSSSDLIKFCSSNLSFALKDISILVNKNSYLVFQHLSCEGSVDYIPQSKEIFNKSRLLSMNSEVCSFNNSETIKLIPEDFDFSITNKGDELSIFFNELKTTISIIYLYDLTSINKSLLSVTLCGQKKLKSQILFQDLKGNNMFFEIYYWVYRSGDVEEKIGLARNIISIHLSGSLFKIEENTYASVKSNYKIYLKNNTKNYLEMKRQIEEHLWNTYRQLDIVKKEFSKNVFTTLIGVMTFFITVILTGALSSEKNIVFTKQVLQLSWAFIIIYILVLIFKTIEESHSISRLKREYIKTISRYDNLIDDDEVTRYNQTNENYDFKLFSINRILGAIFAIVIIACLIIFGYS